MIKLNDFSAEAKQKGPEIIQAITRVVNSGWYILGKEVESFEDQFAKFVGSKYCIGVGNGLETLQISLLALGVKKGGEVITTPLSAMATTLAIIAVGAKPIFVDTNEQGLINPDLINSKITRKTNAILPVHLYGQPADLKKIKKICSENNLHLIEDACQAHGSIYHEKKLGTFGELGCFSFYPTKNLGCLGDGGAIVTNDYKLAKICQETRDYGQKEKYIHTRFGLNSRLDEIQAAILKIKLKYLERENKQRKILAKYYIEALKKLPLEVITQNLDESNFHLFVIKTNKRDDLQKFLADRRIQTLVHYPKIIPRQPFFKKTIRSSSFPISEKLSGEVLSLPCNPYLTLEEVDFICKAIKDFFRR